MNTLFNLENWYLRRLPYASHTSNILISLPVQATKNVTTKLPITSEQEKQHFLYIYTSYHDQNSRKHMKFIVAFCCDNLLSHVLRIESGNG